MSLAEERVALAAMTIVFARCVAGDVSDGELAAAAKMLSAPVEVAEWLYGRWDAKYIAAHGEGPGAGITVRLGSTLDFSAEVRAGCVTRDDYLGVFPINTELVGAGGVIGPLIDYSLQAHVRAESDSRVIGAYSQLRECILEAGYAVHTGSVLPSVIRPDGATEEQVLSIAIAEATCNDGLQVTQRVGDVTATYEQLIIDEHEAELLAIRAEVELRLERAHQILREAGLE